RRPRRVDRTLRCRIRVDRCRVRVRSREHHRGRPASRGPIMTRIQFAKSRDLLAQSACRVYFERSQRIRQALEARLKEDAGLSVSDFNALLLLWEAPGRTLTMSALARKLVFSPSRLNYRIKVLEDAGLVDKTLCPSDGRAHNVSLNETGAQAFIAA